MQMEFQSISLKEQFLWLFLNLRSAQQNKKPSQKKLLAFSFEKCHSHDVLKYFVDIFKMQVDFMNDVYELNLH